MLRALRVADLAIIDELEIVFEPGFNVLTGETGAGKSMLLQALDLTLGGRAEVDLVRAGATEAVVEALFDEVPPAAREMLEAAGLESADELVLRRVLSAAGRTRAYVNGQLAAAPVLRDLAPHLLRVYGQDEHQALRRLESHRELLDAAAGLGNGVAEMRRRYARLVAARHALAERERLHHEARERETLRRRQLEELDRARPVPGEQAMLAAERQRLMHAEKLAALVGAAERGLYSDDGAAVDALGRALSALREAERLDPAVGAIRSGLEGIRAELEDAGGQLGRYLRSLDPDPNRLAEIDERLAVLARLARQHGVADSDALVGVRAALVAELAQVANAEDLLASLQAEADAAEQEASAWAKGLAVERRKAATALQRALLGELRQLALEGARFEVRFEEHPGGRALGPTGWDAVEFWLSTNPGEELRPLARVASGGELSRIMLALKVLSAGGDEGATLIFDEVDAGVGGAVAEAVGRKLRQLGRRRQVLCVTHLPIIAAFADQHIVVAKHVAHGRTRSTARALGPSERAAELARMLGGMRITPEARQHAEELLQSAVRSDRGYTGVA